MISLWRRLGLFVDSTSDADHDRPRRIPPEVSRRISVARIVMITGVVILHVPPHVPLAETPGDLAGVLKALLSEGLFRATVPVLTFLSGYLLFTKFPRAPFLPILRSKVRTLLLPMLIFSTPLVAALYVVQEYRLIDHHFGAQLVPMDTWTFLNYSLGATVSPVNYPLAFLRDLFVVSLLAPIMAVAIHRAPLTGWVACFAVFWFDLDGPLVLRNPMPINFYLGALASVYSVDMSRLDRYRAPILALLAAICVAIVAFEIEDRRWFRLLSPFLVWPVLSYLSSGRLGDILVKLAPGSFFIFLSHAPVLLLTWIIYKRQESIGPFVYWIVAPVVTVSVVYALYVGLGRALPGTMRVILGGRVRPSAPSRCRDETSMPSRLPAASL